MNIKTILLILLLIILLTLVGGGAFYLGTKINSNPAVVTLTPIPSQPLVGNDRDEHGCIGSAGYSWCQVKQKCLRVWEEPCTSVTPTAGPTGLVVTPAPTIDETGSLETMIKQAMVAEHGSTASELDITVSEIIGDYAKGMASASGGGGMWFAARDNGVWHLVWDGNGQINCDDLKDYPNFPNTLIPECYDLANEKLVVR